MKAEFIPDYTALVIDAQMENDKGMLTTDHVTLKNVLTDPQAREHAEFYLLAAQHSFEINMKTIDIFVQDEKAKRAARLNTPPSPDLGDGSIILH